MTWFKVDDKLAFHVKAIRAGNSALGAWVRIGAWCAAHESDGVIPCEVALLMASKEELASLHDAGFLHNGPHGYVLHDYLKYNPSHAELEDKRSAYSDRQKRHRETRDSRVLSRVTLRVTPGRDGSLSGSDLSTENPDGDSHRAIALTPAEETRVRLISSRPPPPKPDPTAAQVVEVLEHWAAKLYPGRKPLFDDKRRKRVKARLAEGFTVERLKRAIDGSLRDDFLMGRRDGSPKGGYRDVATVLRDAAQVERLEAMCPTPGPSRPRNDDRASGGTEVATGVRKLVRAVPSETPLTLEEQGKRASTLAELVRQIGGAK